jgi:AmmeMemoRadiSam system protein B
MVGSINSEKERAYGQMLAKYFVQPRTLFVISSDFCHWGERFQYTYFDERHGEIWKSIEDLDKQGMDLIEKLNPAAFKAYLQKTENTICGRHPISVLLNVSSARLFVIKLYNCKLQLLIFVFAFFVF